MIVDPRSCHSIPTALWGQIRIPQTALILMLLTLGYPAKAGSINGVAMELAVWFCRIRGLDEKVVVVVSHVTCRNEQVTKAESGKFSYFWLYPVQLDQYRVSVFEGAKLFFAGGGTCFELVKVFHTSDARVHELYSSRDPAFQTDLRGAAK
jgi:hypothetical protein